ncbi:hypothetical protein [Janthinobacterium sp. RT4P48]|uniref:hypothetical protein n=1 Tax=Janthinobacterium sp. RT4P48 TaxID=3424188 RepID=UPI003F256366
MNVVLPKPAAATAQETPAPIRQAEPKAGGSYTRNPADGSLIKNPAPATQPNQE